MDCAARAHDLKVEHSATGLSFQHWEAKNTECKGSPGVIARSCLKKKKKNSQAFILNALRIRCTNTHLPVWFYYQGQGHIWLCPSWFCCLNHNPGFPGVGRILPACLPRCWQVALLSSRFRARETHQIPVEITRDETNIYQSLHTLLPVQSKSQQRFSSVFAHTGKSQAWFICL